MKNLCLIIIFLTFNAWAQGGEFTKWSSTVVVTGGTYEILDDTCKQYLSDYQAMIPYRNNEHFVMLTTTPCLPGYEPIRHHSITLNMVTNLPKGITYIKQGCVNDTDNIQNMLSLASSDKVLLFSEPLKNLECPSHRPNRIRIGIQIF